MEKALIRNDIKEKKEKLSMEEIQRESDSIVNQLLSHPSYQKAGLIYAYVSFNQEVRTYDFIKQALIDHKKVAIPKVMGKEIEFYYIDSLDFLKASNLGILEPQNHMLARPDTFYKEAKEKKDNSPSDILVLVPGLAFDKHKNRIGYGKGYYDRFFGAYSHIPMKKIAAAYDFQIVEEIPATPYDIQIDEIITPCFHIL